MKAYVLFIIMFLFQIFSLDAQVTTFPYTESFEIDLGNWHNVSGDDFDWTRINTTTPTSYTGPNSAYNGNYYLFIECDGHLPTQTANLVCDFDFTSLSDPVISFSYHMYGSEMGSIYLDVFDGTIWNNAEWTVSGQQHSSGGAEWTIPTIDLASYGGMSNIQIRFRGSTGNATYHDRGDMAIDYVSVSEKSSTIINTFPYCESFETGWGDWYNVGGDDFDWTRQTGPTPTSYTGPANAHDGSYYLFTECDYHLPSKKAIFVCNFDFTSISEPVVSFGYHMYGNEMGRFKMDVYDGTNWINSVWSAIGQQHASSGAEWTVPTIDLSAYGGMNDIKIRFRGKTGPATYHDRGDMAIDNICVQQKSETIINTFPYCESFETGWGDWYNVGGDDFDWTRQTGPTPTSYTGPANAHDGSYYLFTECDYHLPSKTANFVCNFNFTSISEPVVSFRYHMYGSEMGSFNMDVYDGTSWINSVWSAVGQQHASSGAEWSVPTIDLSAYGGMTDIKIRFRGETGPATYHDRGDMSIDNIYIQQKSETIINTFPYCESFETGWGDWYNVGDDDFDWTRHSGSTPTSYTGPNNACNGSYYLFTECDYHLPSKTTSFVCNFDFTGISDPVISFAYHMYGNEMGSLRMDIQTGSTWTNSVWSATGQQHASGSSEWTIPTIDLATYGGLSDVKIRFRGTTGNATYHDRGDMAIDQICVAQMQESVVGTFPYYESFETGWGDWFNIGGDNFDWTRKTGTTPTSYTGPNAAHDGNYYLFTECDYNLPSKTAYFVCNFDFTSIPDPVLSFAYHMYGSEMGNLRLDIHDGTSWNNSVWLAAGQQHISGEAEWLNPAIDLSAYGGMNDIQIRFRGTTGSASYYDRGDMAIDMVCINSKIESIINTFPYCEGFEDGVGDWTNTGSDDFDWTRRSGTTPTNYTGPALAHEGNYYLFTECDYHLPAKNAIFEANFDFTTLPDPVLSFYYHMYGSEMGTMKVFVNGSIVFNVSQQKHTGSSAEWSQVTIDLSTYGGLNEVEIQFKGTTGSATYHVRGDMAIDQVCIQSLSDFVVNDFPHCESFEAGFGNWYNVGDDNFDWTIRSGSTPTGYTGPTSADDGLNYLYIECDNNLPSRTAVFEGIFDFSLEPAPYLSFGYHMYGSEMGNLRFKVNGTTIWSRSGQQHTSSAEVYTTENIDLSLYAGLPNVKLQFEAVTGTASYHDRGDIAIDLISVMGPCHFWTGAVDNDWDNPNNWETSTIPDQTYDAIIPDVSSGSNNFPVISSNAQCKDLLIYHGGNLTINAGHTFTTKGVSRNLEGANGLIIKSNASGTGSFIDGTPGVQATVERYFTGNLPSWHIISSPISDATANVFLNLYLRRYDEPLNQYIEITDPVTPLEVMEGYILYSYSGTNNRSFSGTLNTGEISRSVSSTTTAPFGWNLMGNPYPSPVDWNLVIPTLSGINNAIYYLDATTGNWLTWNGIAGAGSQFIPPMQGFFVSANTNNSTLTFDNFMRKHEGQNIFYKAESEEMLVIQASGNGFTDKTYVWFDKNTTEGFDGSFDAYKMISDRNDLLPQIYTTSNDVDYSINGLPPTEFLPLGFISKTTGEYSISLGALNNPEPVFLEDLKTGSVTNISQGSYVFSYINGDDPDRFMLYFKNLDSDSDNIQIYSTRNIVKIILPDDETGKADVYDLSGRIILTEPSLKPGMNNFEVINSTGYYMIKVTTRSEVKTIKAFLQ
ncbi:MAG: hypothetical protein K8S16_00210 [Bacteroidales bacterium]|nr:hypothetical protein [Bacteroidales bacterium]